MKTIIEIDEKNYDKNEKMIIREAAKAIISINGKICFQRSKKGDYKLIGGGIDEGETIIDALIREVKEETGYDVIVDSIKEIGKVVEKRKDAYSNSIWKCTNYLFSCEIDLSSQGALNLTSGEIEKGMEFILATFDEAILENKKNINAQPWTKREIMTFEYLNNLKKW